MISRLLSGPGAAHAAVHVRGDRVFVAWQKGETLQIRVISATSLQALAGVSYYASRSVWVGAGAGAYPVFGRLDGRVILAYRVGAPDYVGVFENAENGRELVRTAALGGNSPIAMNDDGVACIQLAESSISDAYELYVGQVGTGQAWRRIGIGRPTGLSRIADGLPILIDDDRMREPGMTLPSYSSGYVAGEHPESGVIVRRVS